MAGKRERHYREIDGQLYARFVYTDGEGKRREKHVKAESKTHARELYDKMQREFDDHGQQTIEATRMTFRQLAETYEKVKLQPAEYKGDRKITGRRSYKTPKGYLKTLVQYFGAKRVKSISHAEIEKFRLERLKTPIPIKAKQNKSRANVVAEKAKLEQLKAPIPREKERSIASVNRELEVMRAVMRFAARSGWIIKSPFETGDSLISKADEVQRERVLSRDEETRLLLACTGRRSHLRPLLIAALDTAMRRGELIQLKWADVDLEKRTISVRAMTTKTARSRTVPISSRLWAELKLLFDKAKQDSDSVFGISDNVKNGFTAACQAAEIEDFRLHDCRHTAITRMIQAGMAPMQVMKISGHTQMSTFARYVNADGDAVKRAAAAIDAFHAVTAQEHNSYVN